MSEEKPQQNQAPSGGPNFNQLELDILKFWQDEKIFEKSLEQTKNNPPYIFYDGPPFATGLPHYGHILASTIKDAIPRYQTMKGRYVRRRWGWDCHGLPIENIVEQNLKISGKKQIEAMGVERFNQVCRENVLKFVDEWGKMVSRMGRWVDFGPPSLWSSDLSQDSGGPSAVASAKADENASVDVAPLNNKNELRNSYKTMDTSYMESVWWALQQVWDKGLIYEDRKVLLYCSRCETPISNFEVAMDNSYREISEESVYAKFKLPKGQRIVNDLANDKTYALAWTTTPWTLPGNTSLNVGSEIAYVMIEMEDSKERYILAKERLSIIEGQYEIVSEFPGRALEGLVYQPLYEGVITDPSQKAHRFYLADFVTTLDGTGIVHNAAMYGEEDYQLAKEKGLPRVDMLDHQGRFLPMAPENLRGVFFKDADRIILQELREQAKVYKTENYLHSYPHCYRCGTPLFYNALPAWFINIQKIKPNLLKNNEEINWYPEHLKHGRFGKSMEQAPDWNISRNRYWATALPFWKCENKECKNVVCIGSVGELMRKSINFVEVYPNFVARPSASDRTERDGFMGNEADSSARYTSADLESIDLHRPYIDRVKLKCEKCASQMSRIPEVVDCWVESASMPFAELHYPFENKETGSPESFENRFPADFVAEYIAQTRAWFYVMHVMGTMLFDKPPFKHVVTTGNILAEDGSKMSKSKNNYPDPWILIEKFGIDAIRFYLLTSPVMNGDDFNFSEKGVSEASRKVSALLYNVWSFLRLYTQEKFAGEYLPSNNILDQWAVAKLAELQQEVTVRLDGYDTVRAGKAMVEFINDLSTWYVRRSRDRIKSNDYEAKQALTTLSHILAELCKLLAPFMPFLSEFIYKDVTGKTSVHLQRWTELTTPKIDGQLLQDMAIVREVVSLGLAARKELSIPVRQPLLQMGYTTKTTNINLSPELHQLVLQELNIKKINQELADKDVRPQTVRAFVGTTQVSGVYLDTIMTDDLKAEGVARELERQVQDLRKKSSLKVGELVDVYYNTADEALEQALLNIFDRKKTFVSQINKSLEVEVDFETQGLVGGKAIWIGLIKV